MAKKFQTPHALKTRGDQRLGEQSAKSSRAHGSKAQRIQRASAQANDYFPLTGMKIAIGGVIL
jgi:hypothetical protein